MTISRKVLSQWLDISSIKDQDIVVALNKLGFEVEQVKNLTFKNTNLVVGLIVKVARHPKSNKLNVCQVNIGKEVLTIVCGAANVSSDVKVIVATIGSKLANGLTIVKRTIQDVASSGMICSLSEMGISDTVQNSIELSGIVHLPSEAVIGDTNPLKYLDLDDTLFEIDVTLNRSDCLGVYAIAKELSSYFSIPLKKLEINDLRFLSNDSFQIKTGNNKIKALATLKITLKQNANKFTPKWIVRILQLVNITPKTITEDISNLVMLELGQPLLAFNGDILKEPSIQASPKSYPEGTLKIQEGDLILHDGYLAFSVLGISYNVDYEVKSNTKSVLIFSINLDTKTINDQIKRHGNPTSFLLQRLTKPIVPDYYLVALQRYLFLLDSLKIDYEIVAFSNEVPYVAKTNQIILNYNAINKIIGIKLEINQIIKYLTAAGCKVETTIENPDVLEVATPSHRNDLNNSNDLAEEVARIFGYDNLPEVMPRFYMPVLAATTLQKLLVDFRNHLISYGFNQVKTYSLADQESLKEYNFFNYKVPVKIIAPLSSMRQVMRFNITQSLIEICQYNSARKQNDFKIFTDEVMYTFDESDDQHHLAFLTCGEFWPKSAMRKETVNPYYIVKGFLNGFLNKVIPNVFDKITYKKNSNYSELNPYLAADIYYNEEQLGTIGQLHPQIEKTKGLDKVFIVEINCSTLAKIVDICQKLPLKFKNWSKYNSLSRDLTLVVKTTIQFSDIKRTILSSNIKFLENVALKDVYTDGELKSKNEHALTFNLLFNSSEEQLDEVKISSEVDKIKEILISNLKATIK